MPPISIRNFQVFRVWQDEHQTFDADTESPQVREIPIELPRFYTLFNKYYLSIIFMYSSSAMQMSSNNFGVRRSLSVLIRSIRYRHRHLIRLKAPHVRPTLNNRLKDSSWWLIGQLSDGHRILWGYEFWKLSFRKPLDHWSKIRLIFRENSASSFYLRLTSLKVPNFLLMSNSENTRKSVRQVHLFKFNFVTFKLWTLKQTKKKIIIFWVERMSKQGSNEADQRGQTIEKTQCRVQGR